MRSLPIFFACVSTWRYRDSRAATPTVTRFSAKPAPSLEDCDMHEPLCPKALRRASGSHKRGSRASACAAGAGMSGRGELPPEGCLVDEVDEGALALDLDDGKPLAVPLLELVDPGDVHLLERERHVLAHAHDHLAGALAERAVARVEERHAPELGRHDKKEGSRGGTTGFPHVRARGRA